MPVFQSAPADAHGDLVHVPEHAHGRVSHVVTITARFLPPIFFALHVCKAVNWDLLLEQCWRKIYSLEVAHSAMMEAVVASAAFFVWITWFFLLNRMPSIKPFRFSAPRSREGKEQVWAPKVFLSLPVYLGAIWIFHLIITPKPLPLESPSVVRFTVEVALGIWAYDFLFFWIHLAMHRWPRLPFGHGTHHQMLHGSSHEYLSAELVVNNALPDAALQVLTNILVQNLPLFGFMRKHKLSRLAHNVLVTYLLTEAHCGLDLPWATHRLWPWFMGGAYRHEIHHRARNCCFHQFFCYLDDALGYGPPAILKRL